MKTKTIILSCLVASLVGVPAYLLCGELVKKRQPVRVNLSSNNPMNRRSASEIRNEEFLASTATRSIDQLKDSLDEAGDAFSFIILPAGMQRSAPTPPVYHNAFLADRRLRKIYEGLLQMPAEDASAAASALFDDYFARYQDKWTNSTIRPERDHYGVAATLFLCAEFCNDPIILNRIDEWTNWYELNQGISTHFDRRARILPLFLMNTYCNMLVRNGASIESVNDIIEGLEETTHVKETLQVVPVQRWDSVKRSDKPIARVPVIPGWSNRILRDPELYATLNTFLRAAIESE